MEDSLGFIILRHVTNEKTNQYWIECYTSIRRFYPESPIVILDDGSQQEAISVPPLYKTRVIQSEYPKRGELLPYLYYARTKWFDTAVILHDSVFLNQWIDFNTESYRMLWDFKNEVYYAEDEFKLIWAFQDEELIEFYKDRLCWKGCFGGMSVIKHSYLTALDTKYKLETLIQLITTRDSRCSFERVLACLLQVEGGATASLFGDIHDYMSWGSPFEDRGRYSHLPAVKVWTGR